MLLDIQHLIIRGPALAGAFDDIVRAKLARNNKEIFTESLPRFAVKKTKITQFL